MGKNLFIAEKPSVAQEFAKVLKVNAARRNGYLEGTDVIITWCVGHLVTMSYPEVYDPALKRWTWETLPFLPEAYKYEVIDNVKEQFRTVSNLLNREDVDTIYVCTDSGREGEYIYRLVEQEAGVQGKRRLRVWIDSQTEEEILRGIREAKDLSDYDNLSASAYLRAKEDYLMGINFSRLLTLKFGNEVSSFLGEKRGAISIGRVMTCVLGMVVRREREIRDFQKTMYYRVMGSFSLGEVGCFLGEWRAVEPSRYYQSPLLYKENGFRKKEDAEQLIRYVQEDAGKWYQHHGEVYPNASMLAEIVNVEKKTEKKYAPLLYNLAELQNDCSKRFKISPDETLRLVQELYEKKLVTYPRTDARVLSTAVAKEIGRNLSGLRNFPPVAAFAEEILQKGMHQGIAKSKYTNDKQITDHYAIIPTGQGLSALRSVSLTAQGVYEMIAKRFLSIFYPPAVYRRYALRLRVEEMPEEGLVLASVTPKEEHFFANFRALMEEGYYKVVGVPQSGKKTVSSGKEDGEKGESSESGQTEVDLKNSPEMMKYLDGLKKGSYLPLQELNIKESETMPPSRYNSGTMILAMENAGQLIEDEELRAQIKGSGIGTSATRAEILKKLITINYLNLNKKTQIITPTLRGELVYEVVDVSMRQMLNPELTASWEKGLSFVAEGRITSDEYMQKLQDFIIRRTNGVKSIQYPQGIRPRFGVIGQYYKK